MHACHGGKPLTNRNPLLPQIRKNQESNTATRRTWEHLVTNTSGHSAKSAGRCRRGNKEGHRARERVYRAHGNRTYGRVSDRTFDYTGRTHQRGPSAEAQMGGEAGPSSRRHHHCLLWRSCIPGQECSSKHGAAEPRRESQGPARNGLVAESVEYMVDAAHRRRRRCSSERGDGDFR